MVKASAILLTSLCTLALLGGCSGNRQAQSAPDLTAAANQGGPWFCQPGTVADDWDCSNDPDQVANPVPDRKPQGPAPDAMPEPLFKDTAQPPAAPLASLAVPTVEDAPVSPPTLTADAPAYQRLAYQPPTPVSLLELPANYYAVQLTAMSSAAELENFFRELELEGLTAAQVERDGSLFYILLLGVYENFAVAQEAATDLPPPLNQYEPWIRRLGTLQAAMVRAERASQGS